MLKNYLTIALRNILRHKTYSFINIAGLAVGMAACLLILLYVEHELSYDRFYEDSDRIYRIVLEENVAGEQNFQANVSEGVTNSLDGAFPEIENLVVARPMPIEIDILADEKYIKESHLIEAGPAFFEVFKYRAIRGNLSTALREPGTAVITSSTAQRYFGDENPIGRTISYEKADRESGVLRYRQTPYQITAVVEDPPAYTHLPFNVVSHYSRSDELAWNRGGSGSTYVLLQEGSDPTVFEDKLQPFITDHALQRETEIVEGRPVESEPVRAPEGSYTLHLQPVSNIHLFPEYERSGSPGDTLFFIYVFTAIALIVLLIACLNYVNLTTAQALRRIREVGIRKTVGAGKTQVILQFIGESMAMSLIAMVFALLIVELFLPSFNAFIGKQVFLNPASYPAQILICLLIPIITGLAGGIYPALIFSSHQVGTVLKAGHSGHNASKRTRNAMVVFQFAVSIALILTTTVIYRQMDMIRSARANIGDDEIILLETFDGAIIQRYGVFRDELLKSQAVVDVTYGVLSEQYTSIFVINDSSGNFAWIHEIRVAENLLETFGIQPELGQSFLEYAESGSQERAFIINKKTGDLAGMDNPVGQTLQGARGSAGIIIGVLEDYHVQPLYEESEPAALFVFPEATNNDFLKIMVRVRGDRIQEGMEAVSRVWETFIPDQPPSLAFFDEELDQAYLSDIQLGHALGWFTFLAILIAALGLFGLAAFAAERRTKEIGIRKVVGASVMQLVTLLSREFLVLVLIANVIAWPIAWYAMNRWLENFAYRIDLGLGPFILAGLLALVIALATVSWQTVRAATANPVEALRYE